MGATISCLGRDAAPESEQVSELGFPELSNQGSDTTSTLQTPAQLESDPAQFRKGGALSKVDLKADDLTRQPQPLAHDSGPPRTTQPPPGSAHIPKDPQGPLRAGVEADGGSSVPSASGQAEEAVEEEELQQVTGKPWDRKTMGAPYPPNGLDTARTAEVLGLPPTPQCSELNLIMRTLCRVFEAPYSCLALYYNRRVWVTNSWEWPRGDWPWKVCACPWNCLVTQPQVIACGELQEDARFSHQPWVDSGMRCYVSAPLLASNGHRMGTVCFLDTVPRRVDAGMCRVLNNFGELAIRVLERHIGLAQRLAAAHQAVPHQLHTLMEAAYTGRDVRSSRSPGSDELRGLDEGHWDQQGVADDAATTTTQDTAAGESAGPQATAACLLPQPFPGAAAEPLPADVLLSSVFARQLRSSEVLKDACTLVVDTGVAGWTVMYADETWKLWAGFSRNDLLGRPLQALLSPATPGVAPLNWAALQREVEGGERFVVPGVVALAPQAESQSQLQRQLRQQAPWTPTADANACAHQPSQPCLQGWRSSGMAHDLDMQSGHNISGASAVVGKAAWHPITEPDSVTDTGHLSGAQTAQGSSEGSSAPQSMEDLLYAVVQHESTSVRRGQLGLPVAAHAAGSSQPTSSSGVEMWHEASAALPNTRSSTPSSTPAASASNITNDTTVTTTTTTTTIGTAGRMFDLSFRPLALDVLDEDALPLGIPSWVPLEACAPMLRLYAVRLHVATAAPLPPQPLAPSVKLTSARSSTLQQLAGHLFPGLGMGQVLGRGGYGTAYTGTWHDVSVVVKVQDHQLDGMESLRTAQVEVALGQMLRHPHLVRTLGHGAAEVAPASTPAPTLTPKFLDTSGKAQLGLCTGLAGGNVTSPCPPPSQLPCPRPQLPIHAGFSRLSKWIAEAENDWDAYGANSWFSDCSEEDLIRRTLVTSNCATGTSFLDTNVTMLRVDQLPPPINFINAVAIAPDAVPLSAATTATATTTATTAATTTATTAATTTATITSTHSPPLPSTAEGTEGAGGSGSSEPSRSMTAADSSCVVALESSSGCDDDAAGVKGNDPALSVSDSVAENSHSGSIHSAPTWALDTRNISYLPVTDAPAPMLPHHNRGSTLTVAAGSTNAPAAANGCPPGPTACAAATAAVAGQQPVKAAQPQEALLQAAAAPRTLDVGGAGDQGVGEEGPGQQVLPGLPGSDGPSPTRSPFQLPTSFLLSGGCDRRGEGPKRPSSTLAAAGTSRGVSNSSLGDFKALQRVSTEMASLMNSAQRHATHVGAKPMQFPMHLRTFAILEYCDGGTLQDAVDRGWLRKGSVHIDSPIDLSKVVTLASHVACAAAYLHERGVVHADLSAANVLLCSKRPIVSAGEDAFLTAPDLPTTTTSGDTPTISAPKNNQASATTPWYQATALSGSDSSWYQENASSALQLKLQGLTTPQSGATAAPGNTTNAAPGITAGPGGSNTNNNTNISSSGGEELLYTLPTKRYSLAPSKARAADEFEFVAKVSDFGKSCLLGPEGVIKAGGYATVTHMAPEVLREHLLSPAADVYALGVLIWQMYTSCRPWAGMTHRQVYSTVISGRVELEWPDKIATTLPLEHRAVAARLVALGRTCLAHKAAARPTMAAVERELNALAQQLARHQDCHNQAK